MFPTQLKSLVSLCCLISLTALAVVASPAANARTSASPFAAATTVEGDRDNDSDNSGDACEREEVYRMPCEDTEMSDIPEDQIVAVVEVTMCHISWFEAETADGSRFKIDAVETNVLGSGHGAVQINRMVFYVCWY